MKLSLRTNKGEIVNCEDILKKASGLLHRGYIIAVKGIGGFHLACDARDDKAVQELRKRKKRRDKPFALMAKDMEAIRKVCIVSREEEAVLQSSRLPIVLLEKTASCSLPESVAPGMKKLGIMLPYTDIHASLFCDSLDLLIMTSANISNSPIQYKDSDALNALSGIADYFLCHDNEIDIPLEDSVVKVFDKKECIVRGGRGYAPYKINLKTVSNNILALGSEQKGAFSILKEDFGYLSRCFGDLKEMEAYKIYQYALERFLIEWHIQPSIIAYDMHPSYITTQQASKLKGEKIAVQHHHAHMASCMAEHGIDQAVIGVIYDGTGYGTDGAIWGGEFLVGDRKDFQRVGHLKYVELQGGDQSVKEPWRTALSYLYAAGIDESPYIHAPDKDKQAMVKQALKSGFNCYPSSSMGRLFDCISALLDICQTITYDAQAAILLENMLDSREIGSYSCNIYENVEGEFEIDYREIIEGVLKDINNGIQVSEISSRFHNTICRMTLDMAVKLRELYRINTIVLSGGCFENTYLLNGVLERLLKAGFSVYYNQQIPINDSGISIGQLAIAKEKADTGDGSFCHIYTIFR